MALAAGGFFGALWLESSITDSQEVQENVRYLRSMMADEKRFPANGINLAGATLTGIDLSCANPHPLARGGDLGIEDPSWETFNCVELEEANLAGANLTRSRWKNVYFVGADMRSAILFNSDLRGSILRGVDLRDADMREARLDGADLTVADVRGADLREAYLEGANLRSLCYNGATLWPNNFRPPQEPLCDR